jgi:hypothetical protein
MMPNAQPAPTLTARRLFWARVLWVILAILLVVTGMAGRIQLINDVLTVCDTCPVTSEHVAYLQSIGVSRGIYVAWQSILLFLWPLTWGALGCLIFWRRSQDRAALILSALMMAMALGANYLPLVALAESQPAWVPLVLIVAFLGNLSLAYFFLFPNGHFVPRWGAILILANSIVNVSDLYNAFLPEWLANATQWPIWFQFPLALCTVASFIFALFYRYWRLSTRIERQQIRWVVFATTVGFSLFILTAATVFLPGGLPEENVSFITLFIQPFGWVTSILLIPVAITISILFYRLWDIDVIIRKTLVYTVLSGLLALVYLGMVVLLQSLFDLVSGQQSPIAIVITTLVIAALFAPLRRRVQAVIDRRFFRQKYDAQQVLAQFAQVARDETEMETLTAELIRVVQETMQPEQVWVWLKPAANSDLKDFRNV